MSLESTLSSINSFIWGPPLLLLLSGTGLYLTFRLGFIQFIQLPRALSYLFRKEKGAAKKGDVSSFAALCTALAATIGTGNIVGVATAVQAGGPGAVFWMWIVALLGMATKYAECLLAVKYRVRDKQGFMAGGPMYYIERGLGIKWLAKLFALFGILVAFFGIGTFPQINAITHAMQDTFSVPIPLTASIITALVALIILGGVRRIAIVSSYVVPFMAVLYVLTSLIILAINWQVVPQAIGLIIYSAFNPTAALGGALGYTVMKAIQSGVARGIFSNESGLGSAPIAAAAAQTKEPVRQGLISMTGTFLDTIVVCSMTGIVLVITGAWQSTEIAGAALTNHAFSTGLGSNLGGTIVTVGLLFFAFTTILGWCYYGERCFVYLAGTSKLKAYRFIFIVLVGCGAFIHLDVIWILADIVNGLMALPNLVALIGLRHVIVSETEAYFSRLKLQQTDADETA
ncbi:sodium:alanine symporter family protein [Pasteurella multocida]|uniref:Sodium:alanine symporter family protein n=1 Tax=Pasteurella multocida TaxID=747 RepID=A0AAW8V5L5_PASMD|nr:sodium:alanine symporter family protein [Pasteurella multocida]MBF6982933.1 sodium:alanine symporter family protein [Pasteurella multocida]MDH7438514.1 sodium:alanine symporter family protein [Pasteurella multocida]MDH7440856.1 sodium:alanine symporter family protein [Pasteurella multocida]MDT3451770.1 sodium:alanine symporter family protein [Pasteurella multocida]MDY0432441.1 sodium:alanine symporter family protein [Pasteurella multocida]